MSNELAYDLGWASHSLAASSGEQYFEFVHVASVKGEDEAEAVEACWLSKELSF